MDRGDPAVRQAERLNSKSIPAADMCAFNLALVTACPSRNFRELIQPNAVNGKGAHIAVIAFSVSIAAVKALRPRRRNNLPVETDGPGPLFQSCLFKVCAATWIRSQEPLNGGE